MDKKLQKLETRNKRRETKRQERLSKKKLEEERIKKQQEENIDKILKPTREEMKELEDKELIPFKYSDSEGDLSSDYNPNGSLNNIAGILNDKKNILGMMPHPERMIDGSISNNDGANLFASILK